MKEAVEVTTGPQGQRTTGSSTHIFHENTNSETAIQKMTTELVDDDLVTATKPAPERRQWELVAVLLFALIHVLAPAVIGEIYPFTVAPMFRDQPSAYCVYHVQDANGKALPLEDFGLHLVYDGNPVGLGVGLEAQPTLHGFGEIPKNDELIRHVQSVLKELDMQSVEVRQTIVSVQDHRPSESIKNWVVTRGEE